MSPTDLIDKPAPADTSLLTRRVTVAPGMCGAGSLFFGQLGDWTWEAVKAATGTNVYAARSADGHPTYLSFYYFRVRGSRHIQPYGIAFGDEFDVTSRVFDLGPQSVMTLHRLSRPGTPATGLDPRAFHEEQREDCLYVENYNRWISRSHPDSNEGLVEASPAGHRHDHLPPLPAEHSPRGICGRARKTGTFHPGGIPGRTASAPYTTTYTLDRVRDLNGAGLMYFASYFAIVDTALLRQWRALGRDPRGFSRRTVVDHRIGYFGNADADAELTLTVRLWHSDTVAGDEIADVAVTEAATGRLLAVCSIQQLLEDS
ncbi:LnmK family bifunctional acyltransferase/decarboxylase [Streptomyces pristinaespiralis]|uniref:LnmK family bifunctional acyltransferase/decarboxylase n=1 Tax=Streptomyces pristinaespiralis TaxID=38300 RepID=UPI0038382C42